MIRPVLPYLQSVIVFVFLGGNPIIVALVGAGLVALVNYGLPLIRGLEPWWRVQQRIPSIARHIIGFVLALAIGYFFGSRARGNEWTVTLLSMASATIVVFLCTFVPPPHLRSPGKP